MCDEKRWWWTCADVVEKWHLGLSRTLSREASFKKRSRALLEILALASTLAAAVWVTSQLPMLQEVGERLRSDYFFEESLTDGEEFDYIVVGAGAAGSAVAARLALAGNHVLLVEAGEEPYFISKMPGATLTLTGSSMDWYYETLSNNKSCLAGNGQACRFIRGRCVGGSTTMNFMMYTRGNRLDYDFNITGWTWEDLKPYFLRYEGLYDLHRLPKSSAQHHNTSGIIPIGFFGDSANPWHERIIEGLESLGVPYNPDVNGESQIGVSQVLGFTVGGERVNTAKRYLDQKRVKRKLKLVKNTRCTGVIIDKNNVARGVTVFKDNKTLRLYAKREVVLSAGAIATPQLLMLSGIGPKDHLKDFGIAVKSDLPVGDNMSDHVLPVLYIQIDDERMNSSIFSTLKSKGLEALQWFTTRSGPFASISLTDVTTFLNTDCYNYTLRRLINDRPECELPSLQLIHAYADRGFGRYAHFIFKNNLAQHNDVIEQIISANDERSLIAMSPVLLRPHSRGWLRLASADPLVPVAITPNYLDDKRDVEEMKRALRFLEQLVETPVYKKYNASIVYIRLPGCPSVNENGYWECYARHMTQSVHHAVGTVSLGPVLDERLRVRGVKNLRVADASVLPHLPRGNTAAAIIAIAERLSDFLIEDRGL